MVENQQIAEDLRFVREVVERRDHRLAATPRIIGLMWGVIVLVGCMLNDFVPRYCWIFWVVAPGVGWAISAVFGDHHNSVFGEMDRRVGIRHAVHFMSLFWVGIPVVLMAVFGQINGWQTGQLFLLLSGVVYFLAGLHLDRRWMIPGIALVVGASLLVWVHPGVWTAVGVIVGSSLLVSFWTAPHAATAHAEPVAETSAHA